MKSISRALLLISIYIAPVQARPILLISHENKEKNAIYLKEFIVKKFNVPKEFIVIKTQQKCLKIESAIIHICIPNKINEDYQILQLKSSVVINSFKDLNDRSVNE